MNKKTLTNTIFSISIILTLLALLPFYPGAIPAQASTKPAAPYATTITVDSGRDIDTSLSKTCVSDTPCTLRRAIVQARNVPDIDRPVLINFNIPADEAEGYDPVLFVWKINILTSTDTVVFRRLNGGITIDGSTQTGGRLSGPKIFLVGPGTGNKDGLVVGDVAGDDGNIIRGLGFQNFKVHMYLNTDSNLIEDNWFGLDDAGTSVYLRNSNPQDGSGSTGIAFGSDASLNTIQNNVFLGMDGVAAAVRGDSNEFVNNYVGTAADGSVPGKQTDPELICTTVDWLGGGGISVEGVIYTGTNNHIANNIFAGLRQEIFSISTQPDAIRVSGTRHLIENNQIGVDATAAEVGVCGRGIFLAGSPQDMQVLNNTIVDTGSSAISLNDPLYDAVLLRNNTVKKSSEWGSVEGNPVPESAIQLGTSLPDPFENFKPAKITAIEGTAVQGTSGDGSLCENCVIEIFLDDTDTITEALQSLVVVTADTSGNWSATLPFALTAGQGLRTTSTSAQYNIIPGMSANTTTGLSELYGVVYKIYLPIINKQH